MSLQDALSVMLKRNPTLARERLTIRQSRSDVLSARGVVGFDLSLDLRLNRSSLPLDVQVDSSLLGVLNGDFALQDLRIDGTFALSKRFSLGTVLSLSFLQSWSLQDTPNFTDLLQQKTEIQTFETHRSSTTFTLQVVQPLLKGAWLSVNMAPIWQALERVKMVRLRVAQTALTSVAQTARAYWDLVYAKQNVAIKQRALTLAETQLRNTLALIKAGKLADLEKYQVMQVVAARKGELLVAKDLVTNAVTQLRILLNLPVNTTFSAADAPNQMETYIDQKNMLDRALLEHPQILLARKQINISKLSAMQSKNALLPELNFTGSFSFVGSGRNQSDSSNPNANASANALGRAYETLFDPRYHRFFVGFTFKLPLDNRRAKGKLDRDALEVQRSLYELARLQHKVRAEVRQQYVLVARIKQRIKIANVSKMWAQKKLEAEQAKWKLGQSTLFNVLTFQQDLANAELSALRAMIDYRKALVTLRERAGVLLKHYQVTPQPK
jgi:outer membrane protein TolC